MIRGCHRQSGAAGCGRPALFRSLLCLLALLALSPAMAATVDGWLAPAEPVPVGAALAGRVARVRVTPGQTVKEGDVLVELDNSVWVAERDAAQAHLKQADGARDEAGRERKRTQDLFDRTLISEHELNLARNAYAAAAADRSRVYAALADARQRVVWSSVVAPFAATVAEVPAYAGQAVSNTCGVQALVTLVPSGELRVIARTGANVRVYPGQALALSVDGESLQASVQAVTRETDALLFDARLALPAGTALRPGQNVKVTLP